MLRSSQASELSSQRDVESRSQRVCTGVCTQVSGAALGTRAPRIRIRVPHWQAGNLPCGPPLAGSSSSTPTASTSSRTSGNPVTHA
eukprot:3006697-Rhodomonas_salina.1